MNHLQNRVLTLLAIMLLSAVSVMAQKNPEVEKILFRAENFFKIGNYENALTAFMEAREKGAIDALINYKIGVCYVNKRELNDQLKSLPYLEIAANSGEKGIPQDLNFYLGRMYHLNMQIGSATESFEKYKRSLKANDPKMKEVNRYLSICNNASYLLSNKRDIQVRNFGEPINSPYTEYNPVISADESVMAYTALRPVSTSRPNDLIEQIYITYSKDKRNWETPQPVQLNTRSNVGTAGMAADGQSMIIFIGGANNTGNLYVIEKGEKGWSTPTVLGSHVNSAFLETTASISPDGNTIYFASNRPGGLGGLDVYKVERDAAGKWGKAENLGSSVNTPFDDDAPFIHPDGRTLFFTSEGHNTMGGKDIFKSTLEGGKWTKAQNMGYPINTTANDNYFTLTADGKKGYFSSDRPGGKGAQDIYSIEMPEEEANIPLTLVKGRILAGDDPKPVPTTIRILDRETMQKIPYVYNPNKETGNYLIIFPPGKNYDMIIESEGYMPYTININVPNQTYFYELYQEIYLKPIKQFDVIVGQEVIVRNAFYDQGFETKIDPKLANEAMLVQNDSLDVFDIMDAIIASSDKEAYDYLLDLMFTVNPIDGVRFNEAQTEAAKRVYYYDESDEENLERKEVGGETIFTLPTMYVTELAKEQKAQKKYDITYDQKVLNKVFKVYFDVDKSELKAEYTKMLAEVMDILKENPILGIEISGYASADGNPEYNKNLSNKRAVEVLNFFNYKGIVRRRIIARGFGATSTTTDKQEGRRVEIKIVDLNQVNP